MDNSCIQLTSLQESMNIVRYESFRKILRYFYNKFLKTVIGERYLVLYKFIGRQNIRSTMQQEVTLVQLFWQRNFENNQSDV